MHECSDQHTTIGAIPLRQWQIAAPGFRSNVSFILNGRRALLGIRSRSLGSEAFVKLPRSCVDMISQLQCYAPDVGDINCIELRYIVLLAYFVIRPH